MDEEVWVTILDYPNYMVSNFGQIYNNKHQRFLKQFYKFGYAHVGLYTQGETRHCKVHRLVASAFLDNPYMYPQINHIDGDKTNNHVDNLEWTTSSENLRHAFRTGLKTQTNKRPVRIIETGNEFDSLTACADYIGGNVSNVRHCLNGVIRSHRGYTFEYIKEVTYGDY